MNVFCFYFSKPYTVESNNGKRKNVDIITNCEESKKHKNKSNCNKKHCESIPFIQAKAAMNRVSLYGKNGDKVDNVTLTRGLHGQMDLGT